MDEKQLREDIEHLKAMGLKTADLYREACVIIFFRYGKTPTANGLYQLVRKGSMSAPAEALAKFWQDLRANSRGTISHPDLPEALQEIAGELVAELWRQARQRSDEAVELIKAGAAASVELAENTANLLREANEKLQAQLSESAVNFRHLSKELADTEKRLTVASSTNLAMTEEVRRLGLQADEHEKRVKETRQEFSRELQLQRDEKEREVQRLNEAEKRVNLELDRGRVALKRAEKIAEGAAENERKTAILCEQRISELSVTVELLKNQLSSAVSATQLATEQREALVRDLSAADMRLAELLGRGRQTQQPTSHLSSKAGKRSNTVKRKSLRKNWR
ncbi:DNA-binding protein [Massilia yuzhufengensis]|uniref:Replication region DNA-binding N-term n=1 Tax=Massilia yuzhufengensis TaxID=1164594 RepID=A0A1I1R405_9BURK|nr:DNA-binding protein [Massilia yuzhufengensis]SFD28937.1 replication region DNA-binding N-term [Massilia yuzhufengensis]